MKSKLMLTMLALTLAISLVAGGTMAWFTATDSAEPATFTAGTVDISVDDPVIANVEGTALINWNPGDTTNVKWTFRNTGSKNMVFRVVPTATWSNDLSAHNIILRIYDGANYVQPSIMALNETQVIGDWTVMVVGSDYMTGGNWELYYTGPALANGGVATLDLNVTFGVFGTFAQNAADWNAYQDETFTLAGTVLAVQSSNNAPNTVFGVNFYPAP